MYFCERTKENKEKVATFHNAATSEKRTKHTRNYEHVTLPLSRPP